MQISGIPFGTPDCDRLVKLTKQYRVVSNP